MSEAKAAPPTTDTPASPPEVLALKPSRAEDATEGPHASPSQTMYVHLTKPDGSTFVAPLASADYYVELGYTRGKDEEIPDFVAHLEAQAKKPAAEPAPAPAARTGTKT